MILTTRELVQIYEGVIKPFGHPDPLGFMTRVLIESEGDPDYIDAEGKRGFMPVLPEVALELTGATEVQSLQSNLIATLSIDRINFDKFKGVDTMIIAFHFGDDAADRPRTSEQNALINDINESRQEVQELMYPPFATYKDVIKVLDPSQVDTRLTTDEKDFFVFLLGVK